MWVNRDYGESALLNFFTYILPQWQMLFEFMASAEYIFISRVREGSWQ